jgi:hypothetical protein
MTNGYARLQQQAGGAAQSVSCPELSCSSTTMVALLLGGQLIIIIAFMMYKDNKENQAKKFY